MVYSRLQGNEPKRISVVVCTFNRAGQLAETLQSMLHLELPDGWSYEVLVVDNRSTDATQALVAELRRGNESRLRYFYEPTPGVAFARNTGIAQTTSPWIAYCDDDQIADPGWLRELITFAVARDLRMVSGAVRVVFPPDSPELPTEARRLFSETPELSGPTPCTITLSPPGGTSLMHRSVFQQVGSYDPSLVEAAEDTDFFRRVREAGVDVWLLPQAFVYHHVTAARIEQAALLSASRRVGWGFCRRDMRSHGRAGMLMLGTARLSKFVLVGGFRFGKALLSGDSASLLGVRIDAARNRGYAAAVTGLFMSAGMKRRLKLAPPEFRDEAGRTEPREPCGRA